MADVVGTEVHLDAFGRELSGLKAHDAGAVDNDVDGFNIFPCEDFSSSVADCFLRREIKGQGAVIDVGILRLELFDGFLNLGRGAAS